MAASTRLEQPDLFIVNRPELIATIAAIPSVPQDDPGLVRGIILRISSAQHSARPNASGLPAGKRMVTLAMELRIVRSAPYSRTRDTTFSAISRGVCFAIIISRCLSINSIPDFLGFVKHGDELRTLGNVAVQKIENISGASVSPARAFLGDKLVTFSNCTKNFLGGVRAHDVPRLLRCCVDVSTMGPFYTIPDWCLINSFYDSHKICL